MGSFEVIAKGSHQPAKLIVLRHRGGGDEGVRLVGTIRPAGVDHGDERGHGVNRWRPAKPLPARQAPRGSRPTPGYPP